MRNHTGRERLAHTLAERGLSQQQLEKDLDVSAGIVSRWLAGKRVPSLEMAMRMERELGVPAESWLEPAAAE